MLLVRAVRRAQTLEVVALHHTREALALRDTGDVDPLAGDEQVGPHDLADLEAGEIGDPQLREMTGRADRPRP